MAIDKSRFLATGLSLAASFGLTLAAAAARDDSGPDPSAPANPAPAHKAEFLLLRSGRLIQGVVARQDSHYVVTQRLGVIRFPERQVERSFRSVREAYQYKQEQLPENDPGERLKLAQWCIALDLKAEAKEQLRKVLAISPEHAPARAMLAKLDQSEALAALRKVDPQVQQAAAEEVGEDAPGALDAAVFRRAQRGMGVSGLPVIFDLSRPLAIKRADEFAQYVQPVLQVYCAKCHNGDHEGEFQLVTITRRRDRTADALRANLDATLKCIDRENPSDSKLLTTTLRPHGRGPVRKPIFPGSNNRYYQILAHWVDSVCPARTAEAQLRPAGGESAAETGGGFASDRVPGGAGARRAATSGLARGGARATTAQAVPIDPKPSTAYRHIPGRGMVPEDQLPPDPREFPLPYILGGPKPSIPSRATPNRGQPPAARPSPDDGSLDELPPLPGGGPTRARTGAGPAAESLPRDSGKASETSSRSSEGKPSRTSLKMDPGLLERVLNARGGP